MFLRKKKNKSGSVSVQIISKTGGKYKVVKTIGFGKSKNEIDNLLNLGMQEIDKLLKQPQLFISQKDTLSKKHFQC